MTYGSYQTLNASDVVQAVFSSSLVVIGRAPVAQTERDAAMHALADVETALLASGITFAEYLDRLRNLPAMSAPYQKPRWRYSARERALRRVDDTIAELCRLTQNQIIARIHYSNTYDS